MIIREEHGSIMGMYFLLVFFLPIAELLPIRLSSGFSDETDPEQAPQDLAARLADFSSLTASSLSGTTGVPPVASRKIQFP
jgi:hypothetical protein